MCTQVIKESLRMFPVAATGLSRCTDEDTILGGYLIPAGTEVQARHLSPNPLPVAKSGGSVE